VKGRSPRNKWQTQAEAIIRLVAQIAELVELIRRLIG
jgi:hypothetical protein